MRKLFVLLSLGMLAVGVLTATGSAAGSRSHAGACVSRVPGKMGRFGGIISAQAISGASCTGDPTNPVANPPLLWNGGPVMGTDTTGPITVTPIYWEPNGYFNAGDYRLNINQYISDVAAASGS